MAEVDEINSNPQQNRASVLMNDFHDFCAAQGWDCYSAVFTGEYENFDCVTLAGNNFIRRCTTQSHMSEGRRMICGLPDLETENIDEASSLPEKKPQ